MDIRKIATRPRKGSGGERRHPPNMAPLHLERQVTDNLSNFDNLVLANSSLLIYGLILTITPFWFLGFLSLVFTALSSLAIYYARRPHLSSHTARVLKQLFFYTFTYRNDRRAPRLYMRMSVIAIAAFLNGVLPLLAIIIANIRNS